MAGHKRIDWKRVADAVGAAVPRERFDPAVLEWLEANGRGTASWHVALSGGADSVALLLSLWAHWPERRGRLRALHFDHRLRGAASRADAEFSRRLCRALGVKLIVGHWNRLGPASKRSEAVARAARHAFFGRYAKVLWLGHHQDDVAETVLMRLARGSGAGGLSAPRPVQVFPGRRVHLRPLLGFRKQELTRAIAGAGGTWRDDASNASGHYFRNRIRRDVVPAWVAAAERDAVAGAARSRQLLAEDDAALEAWVDALDPIDRRGDLSLRRLAGRPRAVIRRSLHRWLLRCRPKVDLSRQAFETLLASVLAGKPTRHSLGIGGFAVIRGMRLRFEKNASIRKLRRPVN